MKNKHEQLYVAIQDLLIELNITPKRLRDIAANKDLNSINPKTAQKLINADLIVEEINWRKSGNVFGQHQKSLDLLAFDAIKSRLLPQTLWLYLQEHHPGFVSFDKIKSELPPGILWSYLQEEYPEVLSDQIKNYLFPTQ